MPTCLYKCRHTILIAHLSPRDDKASVIHIFYKEKTAPEGREKFVDLFRGFRGPPVWRGGPEGVLRTDLLRFHEFADVSPYDSYLSYLLF